MEYRIEFSRMVNRLVPVKLRTFGVIHLAWLVACVQQLQVLNFSVFEVWFEDVKRRARRNGQKLIFETALNEELNDGGAFPIRIENKDLDFEQIYFHTEVENYTAEINYFDPIGGAPVYFESSNVFEQFNGFIVWIPNSVLTNWGEPKIISEIEKHRVAGTKYQINYYG